MHGVFNPARPVATLDETIRTIDQIVQRGRTLLVGPWLGEVGYEALYWLPFLHWIVEHWNLRPDRLVAISRGGVRSWYTGIASRYLELFDFLTVESFTAWNVGRGAAKQFTRSAFDEMLIDRALTTLDTDADVLHPALLYNLRPWKLSPSKIRAFTRYPTIVPPTGFDRSLLPPKYVAMKFYAGDCLPDGDAVRVGLARIVDLAAMELPVVLLDTGLKLRDGHYDYKDPTGTAISARQWMTPATNLAVQTQIIAGSEGYVGPCGGITWIAPRLGVDTTALMVPEAARARHHTEIATAMFKSMVEFQVRDPRTYRKAA